MVAREVFVRGASNRESLAFLAMFFLPPKLQLENHRFRSPLWSSPPLCCFHIFQSFLSAFLSFLDIVLCFGSESLFYGERVS